jgi:hypothetical protein
MKHRDHRSRWPDPKALDHLNPVGHVVAAARRAGCTCDPPDVTFSGPVRAGAIVGVQVGHDANCPLVVGPRAAA